MIQEQDFYKKVAETLIQKMEEGTAPWQKPWDDAGIERFPTNLSTGCRYRGGNLLHLMAQGYDDPRWLTYRQTAQAGAQVRAGEHGTPVIFWKHEEDRAVRNEDGSKVQDSDGKTVMETIKFERPKAFMSYVFNAEQIEGLPPLLAEKKRDWEPVERAEALLHASGAVIEHKAQGRAFYRSSEDKIVLPKQEQFTDAAGYYDTALHELGHWTGHKTRLNRSLGQPFGSAGYAREELRAEIASMMLTGETGVPHTTENSAAYVQSWIALVREDPKEIFQAASDAQKIMDYVMALELQQELSMENTQDRSAETVEGAAAVHDTVHTKSPQTEDAQTQAERCYLHVPYKEKDEAKKLGAKWDRQACSWYAAAGASLQAFSRWLAPAQEVITQKIVEKAVGLRACIDAAYEGMTQQGISENQESAFNDTFNSFPDVEFYEGRYLTIRPEDSEEVMTIQKMGAEWDTETRSYYVPEDVDLQPFSQWITPEAQAAAYDKNRCYLSSYENYVEYYRTDPAYLPQDVSPATAAFWAQRDPASSSPKSVEEQSVEEKAAPQKTVRQYLAVPYESRTVAQAAGALWDSVAKSWYAGPAADMPRLDKWLPDRVAEQSPAMPPREEFADVLRSLGCKLDGGHPIMDGKTHRIATTDDKSGQLSGFYVGYMDARPAGFAKNNRSGEEVRWKSTGVVQSVQAEQALRQQCKDKRQERASELEALHAKTAQRILYQLSELHAAEQPTPYMQAKGISPRIGAFMGNDGDTCLPAQDADGKLWTMQYIKEDGTKRFAKDGKKDGCFHAVGGTDALRKEPVLVIAEGYATASSLSDALGMATVAAFDAGNVVSVAKALHEKYPDKAIVICGDDDRHLPTNPGRSKAGLAAKAVGGEAVFPVFAPGESGKSFTDFNDLAVKSTLGLEAVKRQVTPIVEKVRALKQAERAELHNEKQQGKSR